jgi:hypothetical protein
MRVIFSLLKKMETSGDAPSNVEKLLSISGTYLHSNRATNIIA